MDISGSERLKSHEQGSHSAHTVHIPVMGTGFTIDTPLRVARYGISSVVSLGDDHLIEAMRQYHSRASGLEYAPIETTEPDSRARRITAYLDMMDRIVIRQVAELSESAFSEGSEITRYFRLMPDCPDKHLYLRMLAESDGEEKFRLQEQLRTRVAAGDIDVNIMAKINGDCYMDGRAPDDRGEPEHGVAMSALRGFACSSVNSAVVLSAGFDRQLFSYMASFDGFYPTESDRPTKRIIVKVSDYRSALVQGKMLAKLGLWPSEFRIESGLNCGGHAFATKGMLMGPILEEFRLNREALEDQLRVQYQKALAKDGRLTDFEPKIRITAQGGVGTGLEHKFLLHQYGLDSVGWGTPFLLVPEVTCVDQDHLRRLAEANINDVSLSEASPLGVPFWRLNSAEAEVVRHKSIARGNYGSSCPKGFLKNDTEFSKSPICKASLRYQQAKAKQLEASSLTTAQKELALSNTQQKTCLCLNLAAGALGRYGISDEYAPTICCGPGIADFSRITSLEEMIDHIYDRRSLPIRDIRPHMFLTEAKLYLDYLSKEIAKCSAGISDKSSQFLAEFKENIAEGLAYYRDLASRFEGAEGVSFLETLAALVSAAAQIEPVACTATGVDR